MSSQPSLTQLAMLFGAVSLAAIGGANVVVPDMHRAFVTTNAWLSDKEFTQIYAIAQAAPGPNVMIVGLLGFRVSGLFGAFVATVAMCGPSAILTLAIGRGWGVMRERPWMKTVRDGVAPVTVGLVMATGVTLARAASEGWLGVGVALVAAIGAGVTKRPLALLGACAVLGAVLRM